MNNRKRTIQRIYRKYPELAPSICNPTLAKAGVYSAINRLVAAVIQLGEIADDVIKSIRFDLLACSAVSKVEIMIHLGSKNGTCGRCAHFSVEQFTFPTPFCTLRCRAVSKIWCCEYFELKEE